MHPTSSFPFIYNCSSSKHQHQSQNYQNWGNHGFKGFTGIKFLNKHDKKVRNKLETQFWEFFNILIFYFLIPKVTSSLLSRLMCVAEQVYVCLSAALISRLFLIWYVPSSLGSRSPPVISWSATGCPSLNSSGWCDEGKILLPNNSNETLQNQSLLSGWVWLSALLQIKQYVIEICFFFSFSFFNVAWRCMKIKFIFKRQGKTCWRPTFPIHLSLSLFKVIPESCYAGRVAYSLMTPF